MKSLNEMLLEVARRQKSGSRRDLTGILREMMKHRDLYFAEACARHLNYEYAEALFKILFLEIDENEEDGIAVAELAYLSLCRAMHENPSPETFKQRILLLHYFGEYFTDAIIDIFLQHYRETQILQARELALECVGKMQLSDTAYLEEHHKAFIDGDEQLSDSCNCIKITPDWSEESLQEALTLHRVLGAYLHTKHKKRE